MSYNPQSVMLTVTQKAILAVIYNAPTPEVAFASTNGTSALVTARNLLERLGLIQVAGNKAGLTDSGKQAVAANNIADETGQLTDDGAALIDTLNAGRDASNVAEGFTLLKSLLKGD